MTFPAPVGDPRGQNSSSQDEEDHRKEPDFKSRAEDAEEPFADEHFDAHDAKHDGEGNLQVAETLDHARQGEIEGTKAEHRKDVAREDEEWIGGDREDGRDGIDREEQ